MFCANNQENLFHIFNKKQHILEMLSEVVPWYYQVSMLNCEHNY